MDGIRGYRGWRWVFILGKKKLFVLQSPLIFSSFARSEGILTCVVGLLFFFAIPDFPEEVSWLTAEERQFVKARLQEDVGESQRDKPLKPKNVFRILRECRLWRSPEATVFLIVLLLGNIILGGFMYFGLVVPAYGYGQ